MSTTQSADWSYELRSIEAGEALDHYTRWILEPFWPHLRGRVIEVGAGIGSIAEYYLPFVDEAVLVEPAGNLFPSLERKVSRFTTAKPVTGFVEELVGKDVRGTRVEPATFDAAVMINVLEHVPDDVGVLRTLHTLLKPGHKIFLFVPAMPSLYGPIDERIGHLRRYTRETLEACVREAGFDIDFTEYFDWLGSIPWFLTNRVLRQSEVSAKGLKTYDRFVVPMCRLVDDLLKPQKFGKNLRLFATKRA